MSIAFDGTDDFIRLTTNVAKPGTTALTAAVWMNRSVGVALKMVFGVGDGTSFAFVLETGSSAASVGFINGLLMGTSANEYQFTVDSIISSGVWQHIALVFQGSETGSSRLKVFVNGSSAGISGSFGILSSIITGSSIVPFTLGATNIGDRALAASLEDLRVYERVLTPQELLILSNGYRGSLGNEVLWISAANPSGNLTTGTANVFDLSGNGNHGTPQNGSSYVASFAPRSGNFKLA